MKTKIALQILICAIFLTACGGVTPYPTPLTASPIYTISTLSLPTVTSTPTLTPAPWYTPTPETLYGYPTPEPVILPTCGIDGCMLNATDDVQRRDFTFHELYVGKYVLRNSCNINPNTWSPCAVTISTKDTKQIAIWGYGTAWLGRETGADLTGDGIPEIVINTWTGAGDGGSGTLVYEAGDTLKLIMDAGSQNRGTFTDLNGDGTYEYITPHRIWSEFCSLCSVGVLIVYEYRGSDGYVLATDKFMDKIDQHIQINFDTLLEFENKHPGESLQFENDNYDYVPAVSSLYRLVVYYLLAGEQDAAWEILTKYFSQEQASEYMIGFKMDLARLMTP